MQTNQNDPEFQFEQGQISYRYFSDLPGAKRRLSFAAKRGHRDAQHLLGVIFEEEKAFKSAAKWYRLAAWQGRLPEAAYRLGWLYLNGFGVRKDLREAMKWLRQAAEGADTNAMCVLASLCAPPERYAWFRLAALRKSNEAAQALSALVPTMTREEIVEGKQLVKELRKRIKRPAARKQRVEKSAKVYVGSQEIMGDMCEWRVDLWIQRIGIDWLLAFKGEEGGVERIGPLEAPALEQAMDERGLDPEEFVALLRASQLPMLTKLAREIEEARTAQRD
jgi:hypothetical protein